MSKKLQLNGSTANPTSSQDLLQEIESLKEEIAKYKKLQDRGFGLIWENKPEDVVDECKNKIPVLEEVSDKRIVTDSKKPINILIEGDNYHSLSVLNYTHKGRFDVIYIDPPYNTGAKDWRYNNDYVDINDAFRHSKWLSMMGKRLKLAKSLLKDDGVLVCAIDENEQAHLGALLEELFSEREIHCVTIVHNPRGIQGNNFSYTHEYAFFVFQKGLRVIGRRKIKTEDVDWRNLRDNGGESLRTDAKNCFYPIIVENDKIIGFGDVVASGVHPKSQVVRKGKQWWVYPVDRAGIERKWRYARQSVEEIVKLLRAKKTGSGYEIELGKDYGTVRTVWQDSRYDANEYGTKIVHSLVSDTDFDFPKSIWNTYDCIAPILYSRKDAIVLDYFAGSGTTGHAVMVLNNEDGGNRQFFLCTNNEKDIATEVCYPRIKKVIEGFKDVEKNQKTLAGLGGNLSYQKTAFVDSEGISEVSDKTKIKLTHKTGQMIALREGALFEQGKNEYWQIFADGPKKLWVGIYFKEDKSKLQDLVDVLSGKDKAVIYIFGWGKNEYKNAYPEHQNIRLEDIPEPILEVYKELNQSIS